MFLFITNQNSRFLKNKILILVTSVTNRVQLSRFLPLLWTNYLLNGLITWNNNYFLTEIAVTSPQLTGTPTLYMTLMAHYPSSNVGVSFLYPSHSSCVFFFFFFLVCVVSLAETSDPSGISLEYVTNPCTGTPHRTCVRPFLVILVRCYNHTTLMIGLQ